MKTIFKIITTGILILMLVMLVVPAGYLAWRAGQPMEMPQFKGYTYYGYLAWRKSALHQMAVEYKTANPNAKMRRLDMCFSTEMGTTLLGLPLAGLYTLADIYPVLQQHIQKNDLQLIP